METNVISDESGKVIAIVINNTRYSPEEIVMLQTNTINLADHERALAVWKEATTEAINAYEEERRKRLEAEERLDHYAQRVSDAEGALAFMVDDMLKRGEAAEAIGRVMRYARDYVNLGTDTAFEGLANAIVEYDRARKANGRQT